MNDCSPAVRTHGADPEQPVVPAQSLARKPSVRAVTSTLREWSEEISDDFAATYRLLHEQCKARQRILTAIDWA